MRVMFDPPPLTRMAWSTVMDKAEVAALHERRPVGGAA
jgi:hypothetical protein